MVSTQADCRERSVVRGLILLMSKEFLLMSKAFLLMSKT